MWANDQREVNKMQNYEAVLVLSVKNGEDKAQALDQRFRNLISENGKFKEEPDVKGVRRLAYLINDETEGYYVVYEFEAEKTFPKEFERVAGIADGVLRSLVVVK